MADTHRTTVLTSLEEVLSAELGICTDLLRATDASRQALCDRDPEALQAFIRERASKMRHLTKLEQRATALRAAGLALPPHRYDERARLRSLANQVSTIENELREFSGTTLGGLRKQLQNLHAGRKLLHGYRGTVVTEPRFADRRG